MGYKRKKKKQAPKKKTSKKDKRAELIVVLVIVIITIIGLWTSFLFFKEFEGLEEGEDGHFYKKTEIKKEDADN
jgi:flagellar basal body-associated protein FliL